MQTMAISQFKAQALKILAEVAQGHETIIITKRGKPLAQIIPCQDQTSLSKPGQLVDTLVFEEDIISPQGEDMWEACS
jgi:prevent-host-death family protein